MKMLFIGGGNMASALIGGLIARGTPAADMTVIDTSEIQRASLAARFGISGTPTAEDGAVAQAGLIVFAVKPQQMREAVRALAPLIDDQLVISVAAGIRLGDLARWLGGHRRVVRAMPNTPALIGLGVAGLAAPAELASGDRSLSERILAAVGGTVWVDDEAKLDAVTAISGSGPAYVFLFIEALEAAAIHLGLNPAQARMLAQGTVSGAAQLAAQSAESPAALRERVTSKAGTTAAALAQFQSGDLRGLVEKAARAAQQRSVELGDEFGRD